ncbi:MAG: MFS transporter [Acidobacteria bacterium SCN 69-37]|nr:MAG: MFS transporter [Acidobacteria bacterium SCN 69-37]
MSSFSPGVRDAPVVPAGLIHRSLLVFVRVEASEMAALGWAWLYFFCVLSSYYVLRPIRDEIGVANGVENLPFLFVGTLTGMILFNPPFAALVSRLPRRRFIGVAYRFFLVNLIVFFVVTRWAPASAQFWIGAVFFVWVSVFNMFVVSIFWATLVDLFTREQGKRLFGFIAAGATIGAIFGSSLTAGLVGVLGAANLLLVSALLLELSVRAFGRLADAATVGEAAGRVMQTERPMGGSAWAGVTQVLGSRYLLGICAYMLLFTTLTTFLYFQQAWIVDATITDRVARTEFFAQLNLIINVIALFVQMLLTGRIVRWAGIPATLAILPAMTIVGFILVGVMPTIAVIVAFQVLRRAGEFALARPAREILFTTVSQEEKYKAKSLIDTFVYRLGDQVGAWSYTLMAALGMGIAGIAWAAVPISIVWLVNGWYIGRQQERMVKAGQK